MLLLWYCLIAKPNNTKEKGILFRMMIITRTTRKIHDHILHKMSRAPPTPDYF
jgi:hypothetical protein